jgi:hypothetical protein
LQATKREHPEESGEALKCATVEDRSLLSFTNLEGDYAQRSAWALSVSLNLSCRVFSAEDALGRDGRTVLRSLHSAAGSIAAAAASKYLL